jgi:hypothetical protein
METLITGFMDMLVNILNYQPLVMFGFGIRVFHLVMFWVISKLMRGQRVFS